jgi:hypothetical protein
MPIPNIGPRGVQRRASWGGLVLAGGLVLTLILVTIETPRVFRVGLLLPFYVAGLGLFQAKEKT